MTSFDPNPTHWSPDLKAVSQLVTLIITIVGSVGGGSFYLGEKIYDFAEAQTLLIQQVHEMQGQLVEQRSQIQDENLQRSHSLADLKGDIVPRIAKLEEAIHVAEVEAAAARQHAEDMKETLRRLEDYASKNLAVTESHDADIKATAKAVGAEDGTPAR